ncbi:MAG: trigger factor [Armatimonadota bacterium]
MAVQVEHEFLDHTRVKLKVEVPAEEVQKAIDSVYQQFAKRTTVPGFRPGKAPKHLIERFVDEGRVRDLAMERVLNNAYRDALRQTGVAPYRYAEPEVDLGEEEIDPTNGFQFTATVSLEPHVHLGNLDGFTARRVVTQVTDEEVERELARIRESAATFKQVDDPSQDGDRIRTTVAVTVDGQPIPDVSFPEPTLIEVGANLETLDAGLRGVKPNETKDFDFSFPEDYQDEEYRGKQAQAHIEVSEVWRREVPELDDEFAKRAGFETAEAVRERVRGLLQQHADITAERELNDSLVEELVKRSEVHFPPEMLERQVSSRMADLIKALERRGLTLEQYLEAEETDLQTLQESLQQQSLESLTHTLVLLDFARERGLTVDNKEVEAELKIRAEQQSVKLSQVRRLANETGEIDVIRHNILMGKVAKTLQETAEIRDVEA